MSNIKKIITSLVLITSINLNAITLLNNTNQTNDIDAQFANMQNELLKMFNLNSSSNIFTNLKNIKNNSFSTYPKMNVYENEKFYTYEFALAGMKKEDIKVQIDKNNLLSISGEHKIFTKKEQKDLVSQERYYGKFSRYIQLNDDIDQNSIDITFEKSILKIQIKKDATKAKNSIKTLKIK